MSIVIIEKRKCVKLCFLNSCNNTRCTIYWLGIKYVIYMPYKYKFGQIFIYIFKSKIISHVSKTINYSI